MGLENGPIEVDLMPTLDEEVTPSLGCESPFRRMWKGNQSSRFWTQYIWVGDVLRTNLVFRLFGKKECWKG